LKNLLYGILVLIEWGDRKWQQPWSILRNYKIQM
jgi:hypothetical protein